MNRSIRTVLITTTLGLFAASPALAEKNDWTLSFPETKAHFVKVQMAWAKKDGNWDPTKEELEAKFDQLDANKDGQLSEEEWDNRNGPKKAKKEKKEKKPKNQK